MKKLFLLLIITCSLNASIANRVRVVLLRDGVTKVATGTVRNAFKKLLRFGEEQPTSLGAFAIVAGTDDRRGAQSELLFHPYLGETPICRILKKYEVYDFLDDPKLLAIVKNSIDGDGNLVVPISEEDADFLDDLG